ncbi:MAG: radical SAM protein [Candidatus Shapirobacteria bacterium]|nr:radical SAM protein [Candidatus Shapirobacteria bacterium]
MDLENIYISPLESCNLNCKFCYTRKTKNVLKNKQILAFIRHYRRRVNLKSITFCGGEVFTLRNFPRLVNRLNDLGIFVTIITNGTIDKLKAIKQPHNCQLLVSFDGPKEIHDCNRGPGNFDKSVKFVEHALKLGFPTEIFFLITKDSYPCKDSFDVLGLPKTYLTDRLGSLTPDQVKDIRQNYRCYPPKNFGCSVLSLQSDGKFYGCCESAKSIGNLSDPIKTIIDNFLLLNPRCCDPKFQCNFQNS